MSSSELEAVLAAPAMQPPAGTTPDFVHPPNRNGLAWFVTIFCVAVGTVCLFFRAYARMWKPKKVRIVEGKNANHPRLARPSNKVLSRRSGT